jgi:hypothetical protein
VRVISSRERRLLSCAVAAGPVLVSSFLLEGVLRAGYDPPGHPVSSLAGILYLGLAAGLSQFDQGSTANAGTAMLTDSPSWSVPTSSVTMYIPAVDQASSPPQNTRLPTATTPTQVLPS